MSRLFATCAALAVTAIIALPSAPASAAVHTNAAAMKSGSIEVSSARRGHYRGHYRRAYRGFRGPRYGYYGGGPYYNSYAYDPYYRPYYRRPFVGVGIGPFGFGFW